MPAGPARPEDAGRPSPPPRRGPRKKATVHVRGLWSWHHVGYARSRPVDGSRFLVADSLEVAGLDQPLVVVGLGSEHAGNVACHLFVDALLLVVVGAWHEVDDVGS